MTQNCGQQIKKTKRFGTLLMAALVLVFAGSCAAQKIKSPATPAAITPPAGNSAFLMGHADGTQTYVCLPKDTGASWTVNASRPEATLFSGKDRQIVTHFFSHDDNPNPDAPNPLPVGSPTWQSSRDSSVVWAKATQTVVADPDVKSCPNKGAIPCLLLQAIGSKTGPTGGKHMTQITFIQRLNTTGGTAPASGCSVVGDVGKQALVPYTADYYFFRKER